MRRLIDPEIMRSSEAAHFQRSGMRSIDAMERAAHELLEVGMERFPDARHIFIACGPGGNGGDGYALARLLKRAYPPCDVRIFASEPPRSPDAAVNEAFARTNGIPIYDVASSLREGERLFTADLFRTPGKAEIEQNECVSGDGAADESAAPDVWVDCLYGTGLSRAPGGAAAELIERMNRDRAAGAKVLAVDIPSGLNGRTGARFQPCVEADLTVAFQFAKTGHVLQDGLDVCGELLVRDVGFPEEAFPKDLPRLLEPGDLRSLFEPRRRNIHKGSCGHLLIVAGSMGMAGAAALCANAALRSGVGLVSIACPESIVPILHTLAPCALCIPMSEIRGVMSPYANYGLERALVGKTAVVIGPGLTQGNFADLIATVLMSGLPAVIDADALNVIAIKPQLKPMLGPSHVLTPHPGEAMRLLGRPCDDPVTDAAALAVLGGTAVLKGASRVIAGGGQVLVSASGACGMARGGSGDVYAGVLGALLAERSERTPAQSAAAACEIHGLAGELAQAKYGPRSMNAADLIEFLPEVFAKYVD